MAPLFQTMYEKAFGNYTSSHIDWRQMQFISSPEERKICIFKMGAELGELACALESELSTINYEWGIYCGLFAKSSKQIDILNEACSPVFAVYQDALYNSTILRITRLSDDSDIRGKENLSMMRLKMYSDRIPNLPDISQYLEQVSTTTKAMKDLRNHALAHNDLKTVLQPGTYPLPGISRKNIEAALSALSDAINYVYQIYSIEPVYYELLRTEVNVDSFIGILKAGMDIYN